MTAPLTERLDSAWRIAATGLVCLLMVAYLPVALAGYLLVAVVWGVFQAWPIVLVLTLLWSLK